MVGEGIDGLFGYVVRLFVEPGVTVASSLGAYPTFNFHVNGFGGRLVTTPYVDDREASGLAAGSGEAREGAADLSSPTPTIPWAPGGVQPMCSA